MLLQNLTLNTQYPYRRIGATAVNTETGYMPSQHGIGMARQFQRWTAFGVAESLPTGYNPGIFMPRKHSNMSSTREAEVTFSATATGVLGMPGVGSASFAISADATGGLIASGVGAAAFTIGTNTPALSGTIEGIGSASFAITGGGNIGAIADIVGEASFSFDGSADILPVDDSSPLRSASATLSFSASLIPYAVGNMIGTTDVSTELTANSIVSAVLGATASEWNETGTIGNKINTASSGGVDLNALADAVWDRTVETGTSAEEILRILASVLAGKVSGAGTGTETFVGIDGVTDRVVSTVDEDGNRTTVVINAA